MLEALTEGRTQLFCMDLNGGGAVAFTTPGPEPARRAPPAAGARRPARAAARGRGHGSLGVDV